MEYTQAIINGKEFSVQPATRTAATYLCGTLITTTATQEQISFRLVAGQHQKLNNSKATLQYVVWELIKTVFSDRWIVI